MPKAVVFLSRHRALLSGLMVLVLIASAAAMFGPRLTSHASPGGSVRPTQVIPGKVVTRVTRGGEVNLATLPKATISPTSAKNAKSVPADRPLRTAAQLAAYRATVLTHPSALPQAIAAPSPQGPGPLIDHGGAIPVLQRTAAGLSSNDGGGYYPPDQAIAESSSNVFEGVNNVMEVYSTSFSPVAGPWTPNQVFASVFHSGDTFTDPQITYDASRSVFLMSWLEVASAGNDYIDIAISKTSSPSPLTNYNVYQINSTSLGSDDFCDYDTLGYDFSGMYVTCIIFSISTTNFLGNELLAFSLANMQAGTLGMVDTYANVLLDINCQTGCSGKQPAFRVSPAIEDGLPQAEWIAASDQGFGATASNLTVCALTNTQALGTTTAPTLTCDLNKLPQSYDDPIGGAQPDTSATIDPGAGFKQIAYRNGQLYFAMSESLSCSGKTHDGILWAAVTPELTTIAAHNPQQVNGLFSNYTDSGTFCFSSADTLYPTLIPSSENDMTLVFNYSSSSVFPSIYFTGRSNTDAPGTMGEGTASHSVVIGTASNDSGRWGDYSACALAPNGSSRGTVTCGGEFGGPNTMLGGFGWDTEMYTIRME